MRERGQERMNMVRKYSFKHANLVLARFHKCMLTCTPVVSYIHSYLLASLFSVMIYSVGAGWE